MDRRFFLSFNFACIGLTHTCLVAFSLPCVSVPFSQFRCLSSFLSFPMYRLIGHEATVQMYMLEDFLKQADLE
jgi:hypothetical protein